ncbi:MAG: acetylxylan esterase, partial [Pedobacter sp.]
MSTYSALLVFLCLSVQSIAQEVPIDSSRYPPLKTFTTMQDHANMMQQLGIRKLRPGFSGNESDPNHANYDETLANPCPQLP